MNGILWGRVVAAGVLGEVLLIAIAIPLALLFGLTAVLYEGIIGSFVMPFLFAQWVGRRASSRRVLHGVLIGAVAILVYLAVAEAGRRWGPPSEPQPFLYYVFGHGLKLLGGALGGLFADRRVQRSQPFLENV
jgi:hypothetical protein